jgi:hypothetical protein
VRRFRAKADQVPGAPKLRSAPSAAREAPTKQARGISRGKGRSYGGRANLAPRSTGPIQRIVLVRPSETPTDSGINTAMARPLGSKNKRTLLREASMREAASRAQLGLATTDDESVKADSLAVMEEAMSFFYRLALKEKRRNDEADLKAIRDNLREAVIIAKEVAPYRHARLSSVKVAADRASMPAVRDDITADELRADIFAEMLRLGLLPAHTYKLLSESGLLIECQGVVDGGHNGVAHDWVDNRSASTR